MGDLRTELCASWRGSQRDRERESLPDKHGRDVPVCVSETVKKEDEDEGKKNENENESEKEEH